MDFSMLWMGEDSGVQEGGKMGPGLEKEKNFISHSAAPERHLEIWKCLPKAFYFVCFRACSVTLSS